MAKRSGTSKRTQHNAPVTSSERVVTERELVRLISLHRTTIARLVKQKQFPPPIRLTPSRKDWRWSSITRWIEDREANRIAPRPYFGAAERETSASRHP